MRYGTAKAKYIRVSPRKARLVASLVRGLSVDEANLQLDLCGKKSSGYIKQLLKSAVSNAQMQYDVRPESLSILEIMVDEGPVLKRGKPRSRGSRMPILKRTSHFTIVVGSE